MPDFNIDNILSKFGENSKPVNSGFDIDKIMSQFGSTEKAPETKIVVRPILGEPGYQVEPGELNKNTGVPNPRKGISSVPLNAIETTYNAAKSGVLEAGSGIGDILTNKPATGLGKIGSGLMSVATSPIAGIEQLTGDITGSKEIADRAGLVASAIPVTAMTSAFKAGLNATTGVKSSNEAFRMLVEDIGPSNAAKVAKEMEANPRIAPADLSDTVRQGVGKLYANVEGPHVDYIGNATRTRLAGSKDVANSAFDASMGATVRTSDKLEQLKNAAREVGKKEIEPFLAANPHTDITDLINHIDKEIGYPAMKAIKAGEAPPLPLTPYQRELLDVRNKLRNPAWPDRDRMFAYTDQIHGAQSKLRETAQGLTRSAVGSEQNLGKDLFGFREKMKDAVGPEYKKKLNAYADEKKIHEAFTYGHDEILKSGKSLEHDPSFFEDWIKNPKRKPAELEAAREGARRAINAEINGTRAAATNPASRATSIGQNEFNVQRIKALLGEEEANKLLKTLDDERKIADTSNKLTQGSQSRIQRVQDTRFEPAKSKENKKDNTLRNAIVVGLPMAGEAATQFLGGPGFAGAVGTTAAMGALKVGAHYAGKAKDSIIKKLEDERNLSYSKYALPTQGPDRDQLIQALKVVGNKPPKLSNRSKLRLLVTP